MATTVADMMRLEIVPFQKALQSFNMKQIDEATGDTVLHAAIRGADILKINLLLLQPHCEKLFLAGNKAGAIPFTLFGQDVSADVIETVLCKVNLILSKTYNQDNTRFIIVMAAFLDNAEQRQCEAHCVMATMLYKNLVDDGARADFTALQRHAMEKNWPLFTDILLTQARIHEVHLLKLMPMLCEAGMVDDVLEHCDIVISTMPIVDKTGSSIVDYAVQSYQWRTAIRVHTEYLLKKPEQAHLSNLPSTFEKLNALCDNMPAEILYKNRAIFLEIVKNFVIAMISRAFSHQEMAMLFSGLSQVIITLLSRIVCANDNERRSFADECILAIQLSCQHIEALPKVKQIALALLTDKLFLYGVVKKDQFLFEKDAQRVKNQVLSALNQAVDDCQELSELVLLMVYQQFIEEMFSRLGNNPSNSVGNLCRSWELRSAERLEAPLLKVKKLLIGALNTAAFPEVAINFFAMLSYLSVATQEAFWRVLTSIASQEDPVFFELLILQAQLDVCRYLKAHNMAETLCQAYFKSVQNEVTQMQEILALTNQSNNVSISLECVFLLMNAEKNDFFRKAMSDGSIDKDLLSAENFGLELQSCLFSSEANDVFTLYAQCGLGILWENPSGENVLESAWEQKNFVAIEILLSCQSAQYYKIELVAEIYKDHPQLINPDVFKVDELADMIRAREVINPVSIESAVVVDESAGIVPAPEASDSVSVESVSVVDGVAGIVVEPTKTEETRYDPSNCSVERKPTVRRDAFFQLATSSVDVAQGANEEKEAVQEAVNEKAVEPQTRSRFCPFL